MKGYTQGFRSQTDEQLAAKHDPHPWRCEGGHQEKAYRCRAVAPEDHINVFDPRVECIPSRDPLPWWLTSEYGPSRSRISAEAAVAAMRRGATVSYEPDPRYGDRPTVNPILVALRQHADRDDWTTPYTASVWLNDFDHVAMEYADEEQQIEFARNVLTRLAALS